MKLFGRLVQNVDGVGGTCANFINICGTFILMFTKRIFLVLSASSFGSLLINLMQENKETKIWKQQLVRILFEAIEYLMQDNKETRSC